MPFEIWTLKRSLPNSVSNRNAKFPSVPFYNINDDDPRMSTIIIYASSNGNTKAVAEYIASKTGGKAVDVAAAASEDLNSYDTIVIGGRVWAGKLPKDLVEFVGKNKSVIDSKKSAFYVCCMYNEEKGQKQCDKLASEMGIAKHTFFNKGKKLVQNDTSSIDAFIASL